MKTIFTILFISLSCYAGDDKLSAAYAQIGNEVRQQTELGMRGIAEMNGDDSSSNVWLLKRFCLRLQVMFGVEVPFLAGLKIVPEVEIVAEKN
jgi:hypothetical protein